MLPIPVGGGGGGGGGGVGTHYISMGRDVLTVRVLFSELSGTEVRGWGVIVKNLERDSNMPVWKGVHVRLEMGWYTTLAR